MPIRYFRCVSNPDAAPFKTDQHWEAQDMVANPEYIEIDGDGNVIPNPADFAEQRLPFSSPHPQNAKPWKR